MSFLLARKDFFIMSNLRKYLSVIFFVTLAIALASGVSYFFPKNSGDMERVKSAKESVSSVTSSAPADTEKSKPAVASVVVKSEKTAIAATTSAETADKYTQGKPEEINLAGTEYKLIIAGKEISVALPAGDYSVFDLMTVAQKQGKVSFNGSAYSGIGFFVEEIDGIRNDPKNNLFWFYYVNGRKAGVGITGYILREGDVIEWKFEKFN